MPSQYLQAWLRIGNKNPWINKAVDPPFDENSFKDLSISLSVLVDTILRGNWSLGTAFYYKDICLINQINGGDEWLTIKQDVTFESLTCEAIGRERLIGLLRDIDNSTPEQCRRWEYATNFRKEKDEKVIAGTGEAIRR